MTLTHEQRLLSTGVPTGRTAPFASVSSAHYSAIWEVKCQRCSAASKLVAAAGSPAASPSLSAALLQVSQRL